MKVISRFVAIQRDQHRTRILLERKPNGPESSLKRVHQQKTLIRVLPSYWPWQLVEGVAFNIVVLVFVVGTKRSNVNVVER